MEPSKVFVDDYRLFAPIDVDGLKGLAQVDTGANHSFLHGPDLSRFQPIYGARDRVWGEAGAETATATAATAAGAMATGRPVVKYLVKKIVFLGRTFENITANYFGGPKVAVKGEHNVVLTAGTDILFQKELPLAIDLKEGKLTFLEDSSNFENRPASGYTGLRLKAGLAFFDVSVGSHNLTGIFDTGAGYSVVNDSVCQELKGETKVEGYEETTDPFGNTATTPVFTHPHFEVGGRYLGSLRFLGMDVSSLERAIGERVDLILGLDAIMQHRWVVAVGEEKLYFWGC